MIAMASEAGSARGVPPTLRTRAVAEIRRQVEPLLRQRGISRVAELTGLDVIGVPVWSALRPGAATLTASAGKGREQDSAWLSAVMESLEVRAAERFKDTEGIRARASELRLGYPVRDLNIHPLSLVDDDTVLDWTSALDLTTGAATFVPSAAVGLRGWALERWSPPLFATTSNGLAAGDDSVEACLHGLLELTERSALNADHTQRPLLAAPQAWRGMQQVLSRLERCGASVAFRELAGVAGTSCFVCYLSQPDMPQIFGGTGCSPERGIALERAMLEAVQSRMAVISGMRDDIASWQFDSLDLQRPLRLDCQGSVVLDPAEAGYTSPREGLSKLVREVTRQTHGPILAVDLARDEPWPAVVQVFAPGFKNTTALGLLDEGKGLQ
jgi:ribosomal protein S12 methylthiotransferase accessory factor